MKTRVTIKIVGARMEEQVEVTPAYCYAKAAEALQAGQGSGGMYVEASREWRQLGDSILHMLDMTGQL